jgi:hypothetical protein
MGITSYLFEDGLTNVEFIKTGDLLLFSSEPEKGGLLITASTRSIWTHVGIAFWTDDTPRRLLILESGYGVKQFDELTGTERKGVRLTDLTRTVKRFQSVHIRNVKITRDASFYTKLQEFMQLWKGVDYVSLIKIPLIPLVDFTDDGVSCAELVARYFDFMGLFDDKPDLQARSFKNFLPRDFAPLKSNNLDTSGLFVQSFSPIIYRRDRPRFNTILTLSAVSLVVTLLGVYIILLERPVGVKDHNDSL